MLRAVRESPQVFLKLAECTVRESPAMLPLFVRELLFGFFDGPLALETQLFRMVGEASKLAYADGYDRDQFYTAFLLELFD